MYGNQYKYNVLLYLNVVLTKCILKSNLVIRFNHYLMEINQSNIELNCAVVS